MKQYEVIVIGAGPGGTPVAMHLAQNGKKILLVDEKGKPGGECLFEGCIPSKILKRATDSFVHSELLANMEPGAGKGSAIEWQKFRQKKNNILEKRLRAALVNLGKLPSLTIAGGRAKFVSNNELELYYDSGEHERASFEKAVIAAGSTPFVPPIKGNGAQYAWTNKEVFEQTSLPNSLVIIGAGAIGVEFAQMFSKLGIQCTVIEMLARILPPIDTEFSQLLHKKMIDEDGIVIHLLSKITELNLWLTERIHGFWGSIL